MNVEEAPETKKMKLQLDDQSSQPQALQLKELPEKISVSECVRSEESGERKVEDWLASTEAGLAEEADEKYINAKDSKTSRSDENRKDGKQDTKTQPNLEKTDISQAPSKKCASEDDAAALGDEATVPENKPVGSVNELTASEDEIVESEDEVPESENEPAPSEDEATASEGEQAPSEDEEHTDTDEAFGDESYTDESSDGETLSLLVALQKRRLAFETTKLEFEEKLFNREMEVRKKKLELEMKRIEIEHKWKEKQRELKIQELKIQELEMRERIAKFELERITDKINNN